MYGFVLGRAEREAKTLRNNNGNQHKNTHNNNNAENANGNSDKPICEIVRTYPGAYANLFVGLCKPIPGLVRHHMPSTFPNTSVRLRKPTSEKVQTYLWSCANLPAALCKPICGFVRRLCPLLHRRDHRLPRYFIRPYRVSFFMIIITFHFFTTILLQHSHLRLHPHQLFIVPRGRKHHPPMLRHHHQQGASAKG